MHGSDGTRVWRERDAESRGVAVRANFRFQSVHNSVVVDEDQIGTAALKIRDRPEQRLSWSDLVILQCQPRSLSPIRRSEADEVESGTLRGRDWRDCKICLDANFALVG